MKLLILSLAVFFIAATGFNTTRTITNSGFTFNPATITITDGDEVNFNLENIHNAIEVSRSTWNVNDSTPLPVGFQTAFGGGLVQTSRLGIGTHFYVCGPHSSEGILYLMDI